MIKLNKMGYASTTEDGIKINCLKADGKYNLSIERKNYFNFGFVVENKKRISTVNRWLEKNGFNAKFED
jgi:hypothetical protein